MTLLVTDTCRTSSPTMACKPTPINIVEGKLELLGHSSLCEKSAISKLRVTVRHETCGKGFVPYKRCMSKK
jgi:hypothetical protein